MIRSILFKVLLGVGMMSSALAGGCSSEASGESEEVASGSLSMPLLAAEGAHTYRLIGSLEIYGPQWHYLDLSEDVEVVNAQLVTGDYGASLYNWALLRDDGAGSFLPVSASLSNPHQSFTIFNQATTSLTFDFETDGHVVTVGLGGLSVSIDVTEAPSACTPLGEGCPTGSWCAPPELTGQAVHCVASGPVELGAACSSPLDCGGNSSCFIFEQDAVCAALCTREQFGQACAAGGTCVAQGVDYGVCAPSSPTP